jgi:hypothetical protein
MKWEQLVKGQTKDYRFFLTEYKKALDQLNADIVLLLGAHTEKTAPQNVRDKISRDREAWQTLWEINGQRIADMRAIHQKELDAYFANPE